MTAEWTREELGNHVNFIDYRGKTPNKIEQGMRLITAKNVKMGFINPNPQEFVDAANYESWMTRGIPQFGDVLFTTEAPLGNVAQLDTSERVVIGQRLITMQTNRELIEPTFLKYYLTSPQAQKEIHKNATGATVLGIKSRLLKKIPISYPPIDEQKRIVAILDQAFADIDKARATAERNLKNAHELFESYLQQVFSQRKSGWTEMTLKDASIEFGRGKSKHRPRNDPSLYDGDYPFIQTGEVRNSEHLITTYSKTYNEKGLAQSKLWPKGTICITIAANIAETGILEFEACFPDSVIGIVVDPNITSIRYVEFLLQSFKSILKAQGKGSAQDNINMGTFEKLLFPFPSLENQNDIVNNIGKLMKSTIDLERLYGCKLKALDELKKSILQKAFTGELTKSKGIAA